MKYWKQGKSVKGLPRPFFSDGNTPVTRDTFDRPLKWDGSAWVIDNARLIEEVNSGRWQNGKLMTKNKEGRRLW